MIWREMAPWLVLGLIAAGLLKAWFPTQLVHRWLGKSGLMSALRAAVIGTPLPLCSCSVLPAAIQLHRSGASSSATVAFLVATPENGADSIAMSWALLGPWMTVLRVSAALISASVAGVLAGLLEQQSTNRATIKSSLQNKQPSLLLPVIELGMQPIPILPVSQNPAGHPASESPMAPCCQPRPCCASNPAESPERSNQLRWYQCLNYAFSRMLADIAGWVLVGVVTAAVIQQFFPADSLASWGRGPIVMLAVLAVSVPTYICATASTPIAASLLAAGMSPGTVLVFLLAGPASNFSSAAVVRRELGKSALAGYLFGVVGMSFLIGLAVDSILPDLRSAGHLHTHEHGSLLPGWLADLISVGLLVRITWLGYSHRFSAFRSHRQPG
ncbi:MAG: SO_0444 family Cu/Zn efflux transporter [Planctomyces sp.]|nr:SO_0444 family Cu/Zn efflux transporter [Planctomyces sp.]